MNRHELLDIGTVRLTGLLLRTQKLFGQSVEVPPLVDTAAKATDTVVDALLAATMSQSRPQSGRSMRRICRGSGSEYSLQPTHHFQPTSSLSKHRFTPAHSGSISRQWGGCRTSSGWLLPLPHSPKPSARRPISTLGRGPLKASALR